MQRIPASKFGYKGAYKVGAKYPISYKSRPQVLKKAKVPATRIRPANDNSPEQKFYDTTQAAGALNPDVINQTGHMYSFDNAIAEGTDQISRIGQSIFPKSTFTQFSCMYNPSFTGSTGTSTQNIRLILFIDKQPNQLGITGANLLDGAAEIYNPINMVNSQRFQIIYDKRYALGSQGPQSVFDTMYHKLHYKTRYANATGTPSTNALYLFAISDGSASLGPYLVFNNRLKFTDD